MTRPARIISYDPGGVHTGVAIFEDRWADNDLGWGCVAAYELGPDQANDQLWDLLTQGQIDQIVYETFQLYPHMAETLTGSEMETSQQIGVIRWMAAHWGISTAKQPAGMKKPIQGTLKQKKLKSVAKRNKAGGHAFDAELHGWGYLFHTRLTKEK